MHRIIHEARIFLATPIAVHVCLLRLLIKLRKQSATGSVYFKMKKVSSRPDDLTPG